MNGSDMLGRTGNGMVDVDIFSHPDARSPRPLLIDPNVLDEPNVLHVGTSPDPVLQRGLQLALPRPPRWSRSARPRADVAEFPYR